MGAIGDLARQVFRLYATDGIPSSGAHKPAKSEIWGLCDLIDEAVAESTMNVLAFGVVGDGEADDTEAFESAVAASIANQSPLLIPGDCTIRLTSTVTIAGNLTVMGAGAFAGNSYPDEINSRSGSWLYFDHTGKGIRVDLSDPDEVITVRFIGIGTMRNQPTPGVGIYSAAANDFDFYYAPTSIGDGAGFRAYFQDVFLLNPTKGIYLEFCGSSQLYNIRGQPLEIGVQIENNFDVVRVDGVHFWNWWSQNSNVMSFTQNNLKAFNFFRVDNPMMSNVFIYGAAYGIYLDKSASGNVAKLKITNFESDIGSNALVFGAETVGADVYVENFTTQGTGPGGTGVQMLGTGGKLFVNNFYAAEMGGNAVYLGGSGNKAIFNSVRLLNWDGADIGFPGLQADSGNVIVITSDPIASTTNSGPVVGGSGEIWGAWRSWTPIIEPETGSFGAAPTTSGSYKISPDGTEVTFNGIMTASNNGTGGGSIRITLPVGTASASAAGAAVDRGVGLGGLQFWTSAATSYASILNESNGYPATSSSIMIFSMTYRR